MKGPATKERYYLHGDLTEHDPNLYFCVRCDTFEPKEHFVEDSEDHSPSKLNNLGYYDRGRKAFYGHGAKEFRQGYQRSRDVKNLFV